MSVRSSPEPIAKTRRFLRIVSCRSIIRRSFQKRAGGELGNQKGGGSLSESRQGTLMTGEGEGEGAKGVGERILE